MEKFNEIKNLLKAVEIDSDKFYSKKNAAAGVRIRKAMQNLKLLAQEVRKEITDRKAAIAVEVSYTLTRSADVAIRKNSFVIGKRIIDLDKDQDETTDTSYASAKGKPYNCLKDDEGLSVILRATGKAGGFWKLNITVDGKALKEIERETDSNGRLDHNKTVSS